MNEAPLTAVEIADRLAAARILPVLRFDSAALAGRAADALHAAGFRALEITLTIPGAIDLIAELVARHGDDTLIGAGTVTDELTARKAIGAGARFVVTPTVVQGLSRLAHEHGSASIIGAFTPSEALAAARDGADIVKIFPASTGGPPHIAALHAVLPQLRLCPTGGIRPDNALEYLAAGAALVGIGNHLLDALALADGDLQAATTAARRLLDQIQTR
jgi:2-dehydro-3-deoxyphosphogluconate aldolase/(4S)-4-hydroxy-2-oxoglutarate aldolase